jgi:hypothetical protein
MKMSEWADEHLSRDLLVLRARGENQELEYMESFPQNVRELAKEIAAFATSNPGTILIGVSDTGDLVGLEDALTIEGRDTLLRRIEGICRGTIKPSITPTVKFANEDDKVVLVIIVPKGSQPVYYSNHTPYIRHITESRPAEPHEIVELVRVWLPAVGLEGEDQDPLTHLISEIAMVIVDVLIYADEADERNINPWLEMWRAQFQQGAAELRELAIRDIAIEQGMSDELNELAQALDEVATFRMYLGCWEKLSVSVKQVYKLASLIKDRRIDSLPLSKASLEGIKQTIVSSSRSLSSLADRAEQMVEQGRIEEFQTDASDVGHILLRASQYNISSLQDGIDKKLQAIGRGLHLVETMRICLDGGRSLNAIIEKVKNYSSELNQIFSSF